MVRETLTVINKQGLHMRPAATFVQAMGQFQSQAAVVYGDRRINAKSILEVMTACIKQGSEIVLECSGPDEEEMLRTGAELIRSGLGDEI